jgi:hypothetical protein
MSLIKERMCNHIINDVSLNALARRLAASDTSDLIQELALIVCEKDDEELIKIDNYFNFWCVRVMINMTGTRGNFTKLYRGQSIDADDAIFDSSLEYEDGVGYLSDIVYECLDDIYGKGKGDPNKNFYRRELFKLYLKLGSLRKVEKEVGINYSSVYNTVKEVKQTIIEKL